jgi:hypothetical protein
MHRMVYNPETGDNQKIEQIAYRDPNDHSIVQVLDATDPAPAGMEAFDPSIDPVPSDVTTADATTGTTA